MCREFTSRVAPLGFSRTKKMYWTRRRDFTLDFIHFHRGGSTYGSPINASVSIRDSLGIRVINDSRDYIVLNGFSSDELSNRRIRAGCYHLRFNAISGSTFARCVDDLQRFVIEQGEPWFKKVSSTTYLLWFPSSPLRQDQKRLLHAHKAGHPTEENVATSFKILGIKVRSS